MPDKANARLQEKIMPFAGFPTMDQKSVALTIRPSAIPPGIGLFIEAFAASPGTRDGATFDMQNGLVMTSPQCTGS
jgi:hypothetical protein